MPAIASHRIAYRDGIAAALMIGGQVKPLLELDTEAQWRVRTALLRPKMPASIQRHEAQEANRAH